MMQTKKLRWVLGSVSLLGLASFGVSAAAQDTDSLTVLANVGGECTVSGATLDFGSYTGVTKNADIPISFDCNAASNISISLDGGGNGDPTNRQMSHTGNAGNPPLLYQLFQDSARSDLWGIFPTDSLDLSNVTDGTPTIFGQVLPGQDTVLAGTYSDTIVITLTTN